MKLSTSLRSIVAGSLATVLLAGGAAFAHPANVGNEYFIRNDKVTYPDGYISHYIQKVDHPTSKARFTMINEFDTFEFTVDSIPGVTENDAVLYVFLDDVYVYSTDISRYDASRTFTVELGNADQVAVQIVYKGAPALKCYPNGQYTISNCKFN
ncbi:MAG: hypothetical protein E7583_06765 [Ruminococcaceae bacterium]|nr:hypothetical protein [Oscillospiraceae bacterium]